MEVERAFVYAVVFFAMSWRTHLIAAKAMRNREPAVGGLLLFVSAVLFMAGLSGLTVRMIMLGQGGGVVDGLVGS